MGPGRCPTDGIRGDAPALTARTVTRATSAEEANELVLSDGTLLALRPIVSNDHDRLAALFARLAPESRRLSPTHELTPRELACLTDIDHVQHEAIAAVDERDSSIVGVRRYARSSDQPGVVEMAVAVADDDVIDATFGPGLPKIRAWSEQHYSFAGYVPSFDPSTVSDRSALRAELGYGNEPLCLVSVGGLGVGTSMLRPVIEALPSARELVSGLRMIAVAGPRIDPTSLPRADGLEVCGYAHELYRHAAACDVAVVQGGLTTTVELVATGRPFISLPLANHFEQRFHVRHRLDRYGADTWLDYEKATPKTLADAIANAIGSQPSYRTVGPGGALRAACLIAELL
jgi:hypothetical protein